jgi:hypothetical protein
MAVDAVAEAAAIAEWDVIGKMAAGWRVIE